MDNKFIEGFKKDFLVIKEKGWIESRRHHDTGIGKTFEDLIGIIENNNFLADYDDLLIFLKQLLKESEEERRLMYVAATRAKCNLFVTYPVNIFDHSRGAVLSKQSRFIDNIPQNILEPWNLLEE